MRHRNLFAVRGWNSTSGALTGAETADEIFVTDHLSRPLERAHSIVLDGMNYR